MIVAHDETLLAPVTHTRRIRDYELLERLGADDHAVLYRGSQLSVGRDVMIRVIRPELANRPEFIRRFEAEAQLFAGIEHPHLVPLYDFWREPGSAYLVMRLLRGGNLLTALETGPWPLDRTQKLFDQIAPALAAAHHQGIVHRDIKPANILFDETGNRTVRL